MASKTPKKIIFSILVCLVLIVVVVGIVLQAVAEDQVTQFLKRKIPQHIELEYADIHTDVLNGNIQFQDIELGFLNRDTTLRHTDINIKKLSLEGLGYWDFLMNNTISADAIHIDRPIVNYYPYKKLRSKDTVSRGVVNLLRTIRLKELSVGNGELVLFQRVTDSVQLRASKIFIAMHDLETNPHLIKSKIPFEYGDYLIESSKTFIDLGNYEKLNMGRLRMENGELKVDSLGLKSKFGKYELSRKIDKERDYIDLNIHTTEFSGIDFGFRKDRFYVSSDIGQIKNPDLFMFRDKLVADDFTKKRLYGEMLRELPIDIDLSLLTIYDGHISYQERVNTKLGDGRVDFKELNASLHNISNTYGPGNTTSVDASAKLMGKAPIQLKWQFDTTQRNGALLASGSVSDFDSSDMNQFLKSNLGVQAQGKIDQMYFTIGGDKVSARGDIKMRYRDFKFAILRKDRLGINKLLSAIGNIFVNDGSKTDTDGFRHGQIEAERDPTKSIFNYLWINVQDGIVSTLTGDGMKKE